MTVRGAKYKKWVQVCIHLNKKKVFGLEKALLYITVRRGPKYKKMGPSQCLFRIKKKKNSKIFIKKC